MSKASQLEESAFSQGFIDGKHARNVLFNAFGHALFAPNNIKKTPYYRYKKAPKGYGRGFDKGFSGQLKR